MKKNIPENTSADQPVNFPPPLWLLVDDDPELEIFPRIANFLYSMGWEDWESFYHRIVARPGVIHEHPHLRVAWFDTGDLEQLKKLLNGIPKALVLMDLNFRENGSKHGIELVGQLREIPEIRDNSVFLLKTITESADADKFRRENISYLRILRSLYGNETVERIQFLGANANQAEKADTETNRSLNEYESKLIGNLLMGLQEEAYVDSIRSGAFDGEKCQAAIASMDECGFYGFFDNSANLQKLYINQFLKAAFDERKFPSYSGAALNVGIIKQIKEEKRGVTEVKPLFTTSANDSHALEIALLRYGVVADVEAPLFTMGECDQKNPDEVKKITPVVINQKWNPKKRKSFKYVQLSDIFDALEVLDKVVEVSLKPEVSITSYRDVRKKLDPERLIRTSLLDIGIRFTELREFIANHCKAVGNLLVAPALSRLENSLCLAAPYLSLPESKRNKNQQYLDVDRGLRVVSVERDRYFNRDFEIAAKKVRPRVNYGQKLYVALNREQIAHNLVLAEKYIGIAGSSVGIAEILAALKLDVQCGSALRSAASLAVSDQKTFKSLVGEMEKMRVPLGLPQPEKLWQLFTIHESGLPRDIAHYLSQNSDSENAPLIELVVAGLYVLKFHLECFLRNMEWNSNLAEGKKEKKGEVGKTVEAIYKTLGVMWESRGWAELFVLDLPDGVRDPLNGHWGISSNLLKSLEDSSEVAKVVSSSWNEWLGRREIVQPSVARAKYKNGKKPEDWLRLLWLGLPLDYADELERQPPADRVDSNEESGGWDGVSNRVDTSGRDEKEGKQSDEDDFSDVDALDEEASSETEFDDEATAQLPGISLLKKRDDGNPNPTRKQLNAQLAQMGHEFRIREPHNEFEWDEAFSNDVMKALEILKPVSKPSR